MKKNIRCLSMNSQELVFMGIFYILLRQIPHWNSIIMSSRKELLRRADGMQKKIWEHFVNSR